MRLRFSHKQVILCAFYRPPNAAANVFIDLHDALNTIRTRFHALPLLLSGDFNLPGIDWSGLYPTISSNFAACSEFLSLCSNFSVTQIGTRPTRVTATSENVLDLILSTAPDLASSLTYLPAISDHCLLHFHLSAPVSAFTKAKNNSFLDYGKADFEAINSELAQFLDFFLSNFFERSVEVNWTMFKNKVNSLINSFVPRRFLTNSSTSPWFNSALK